MGGCPRAAARRAGGGGAGGAAARDPTEAGNVSITAPIIAFVGRTTCHSLVSGIVADSG